MLSTLPNKIKSYPSRMVVKRALEIQSEALAEAAKASSLGSRVAAARKLKGWNQSRLAKELKVSRATVSDWESDKVAEIKTLHLISLSDATDVNLRWLATGKGTPIRRVIRDGDEALLLDVYRDLSPEGQVAILASARAMRLADERPPSRNHPYKTSPALSKAK